MRFYASLGAAVVLAATLAACDVDGGNQDDGNLFTGTKGERRCAYITPETKDRYCGESGVDQSKWTSPADGTVYNPADGLTDDERALEVLLSRWPQLKRSEQGDTARIEAWKKLNPNFDELYKAHQAGVAASATPTPLPSAQPKR